MCRWCKSGITRMDPCMKNIIQYLNMMGISTLACCCGHKRYPMSIVVPIGVDSVLEIFSGKCIPRKKKFYKKDVDGYYYIPEVCDEF